MGQNSLLFNVQSVGFFLSEFIPVRFLPCVNGSVYGSWNALKSASHPVLTASV